MSLLLKPLRAGVYLPVVLGVVLAVFVGATLLPQDRYVRFQSLRGTLHARAEWIYDRIHNDPTPIDILITGPSRAVAAIDPLLLQNDLRERTGTAVHVAHFGFAEPGADLLYLMVREAFETKQPKIVVVGVIDQQGRFSHPAFKDLADVKDVLDAPLVFNKDYFFNLAFLPMRQLRLAADSLLAPLFDYRHAFDPSAYPGPDIDTEAMFPLHFTAPMSASQLEQSVVTAQNNRTHPYLPAAAADYEFASQRYYYNRIAELTAEHHAKLIFLFIPGYKGPTTPTEYDYYAKLGSVLLGPDSVRLNPNDYFDGAHLNGAGKQQFTTWLATSLDQNVMAWAPERVD